jgi:RNA polymerase sigma-70 factor, ECF subfamily
VYLLQTAGGDVPRAYRGCGVSSPITGRLLPWSRVGKRAAVPVSPQAVSVSVETKQSKSDEQLLRSLCSEDERALTELFDRFGRLVFGIALRIVRDRGEAEEIVQDVFLQLLSSAQRFDSGKSSGKSWITRIAVHKSIDRRAFLSRRRFYDGTDLEFYEDALRGQGDLESDVLQRSLIGELKKALDELPPKQRVTIEWAFFEGCTLQEISTRLGDTYINVRHYFYRGLEKLRRSPFVTRLKGE